MRLTLRRAQDQADDLVCLYLSQLAPPPDDNLPAFNGFDYHRRDAPVESSRIKG